MFLKIGFDLIDMICSMLILIRSRFFV
jgi:hypothetical protein